MGTRIRKAVLKYAVMTAATAILALGVYFFKFPNHFSIGGVTGLSVVLNGLIPSIPAAFFSALLNILALVVGFFILGREMIRNTVYCSVLLSLFLTLLETFVPLSAPLTSSPLLELMFAVALPAVGTAILFNMSASTGGTDIVALVLKKYTSINVGRALICVDLLTAVSSLFIFGLETALFSLLGVVLRGFIIDNMIEGLNTSKYFFIVTTHPDEIIAYINDILHKGATVWESKGAYTLEEKHIILTVVTRYQAVTLRNQIKALDPGAFVVISSTGEIIGKGFRAPI